MVIDRAQFERFANESVHSGRKRFFALARHHIDGNGNQRQALLHARIVTDEDVTLTLIRIKSSPAR